MTAQEFENIKNRINELEKKSIESHAKMKTIEEHWLAEYGFSTLEEAQKKQKELEEEIFQKTQKKEQLEKQLVELMQENM